MGTKFLENKGFFLLMFGKLVSLTCTNIQNFALALYILKITGSIAQFGFVIVISLIPQLVLGSKVGVFIGCFKRKKVIVFLDMISGILVGGYAIMYSINGTLSLIDIYILTTSLSLISVFFQSTVVMVIHSIIKKRNLVDCKDTKFMLSKIGYLIAPIIGCILFSTFGIYVTLIISSIIFILCSIGQMLINIPK